MWGLPHGRRHSTKPRPKGEYLRSVGNRRTRPDVFALDPKRRQRLLQTLKREEDKHAQKRTLEEYAAAERRAKEEEALRNQPKPEPPAPQPRPKKRPEPKSRAQREFEATINAINLEQAKQENALKLMEARARLKNKVVQEQLREQIEEKRRKASSNRGVDAQAAAEQLQWEEHALQMHLRDMEARKKMQALATQQTNLMLIRDKREQEELDRERETLYDSLEHLSPRSALRKLEAMAPVPEPHLESAPNGTSSPKNRWLHNPRVRVRDAMLQRLREDVEGKLQEEAVARRRQEVHETNAELRAEKARERRARREEKLKLAAEARKQKELLDERWAVKNLERDARMLREKEDLLLAVGQNEELRRYRTKLSKIRTSADRELQLQKARSTSELPPFWVDRGLPVEDKRQEVELRTELAKNPIFLRRPSLGRPRVSWYD